MPLDVTPGGSAADSYLSVADSVAFAEADLGEFAAAWLAATGALQEKALRRATRDLDRYIGSSADRFNPTTQRLAFPRYDHVNTAGAAIIVPRVREATYHQAIFVLANADVLDQAATRRARGMISASEPNVSFTLADDEFAGRMSPDALRLLTGEGFEGGSVVGYISTR